MAPEIQISTAELRAIAQTLFDHLEESNGDVVGLPWDYFWCIPAGKAYDFTKSPAGDSPDDSTWLTVGQLSDSMSFLQGMIRDGHHVGFGFVWLADLFHAIGHKYVN